MNYKVESKTSAKRNSPTFTAKPSNGYSADERKAYNMGRAWEAGKQGLRVKCVTEAQKQSFRNGVKNVRGKQ